MKNGNKIRLQIEIVVYLDAHLGAGHSKRWSKEIYRQNPIFFSLTKNFILVSSWMPGHII